MNMERSIAGHLNGKDFNTLGGYIGIYRDRA